MLIDAPAAPGARRRRDTVLAALETLRTLDLGMNMSNILVFLYVAENEGISVTELATISGLNKPTASRSVRALTARGSRWALPPYLGLVELCAQGPARNSKTMWLTQQGRDLCDKLDALIGDPVRIAPSASARSSVQETTRLCAGDVQGLAAELNPGLARSVLDPSAPGHQQFRNIPASGLQSLGSAPCEA